MVLKVRGDLRIHRNPESNSACDICSADALYTVGYSTRVEFVPLLDLCVEHANEVGVSLLEEISNHDELSDRAILLVGGDDPEAIPFDPDPVEALEAAYSEPFDPSPPGSCAFCGGQTWAYLGQLGPWHRWRCQRCGCDNHVEEED